MMCSAMNEARVPIDDDVQIALADAGFTARRGRWAAGRDDADGAPLHGRVGGHGDRRRSKSSFAESAGAVLPAMLRSFMATELALSPHQILRDAVPLLLLDDDVRSPGAAAGALEQTAHPDTLSPDTLRRAIIVRNWIPASDRPPLDAAIRKGSACRGRNRGVANAEPAIWSFTPQPLTDRARKAYLRPAAWPRKAFSPACCCATAPA